MRTQFLVPLGLVVLLLLIVCSIYGCMYNVEENKCKKVGATFTATSGIQGFCVKDGKIITEVK